MKQLKLIKIQIKMQFLMIILLFSLILAIAGAISNIGVIISNGNKMPILSSYEYETDTHFTFTDPNEINNWKFADIFPIGDSVYSLGDFLIFFGILGSVCIMILLIINLKKDYKNLR